MDPGLNLASVNFSNLYAMCKFSLILYFAVKDIKTGLQPVEQIFGFFHIGFNARNGAKMCSKNV